MSGSRKLNNNNNNNNTDDDDDDNDNVQQQFKLVCPIVMRTLYKSTLGPDTFK